MTQQIENIKTLIDNNNLSDAIEQLDALIEQDKTNDELFLLRGNAYRKLNNWKNAISDYCKAMDINPKSDAVQAYQAAQDIMNFFNKDLYNP